MFVERVPCSRPNTPEKAVEMVDSHHPPVISIDDVPQSGAHHHHHHHADQRPQLHDNYFHVYHGAQRQVYTADEIKQILLQHGHGQAVIPVPANYQPPVRLYDQHHHGHPRHPLPSALYPTPPLPAAAPGSVVRIPIVDQHPDSHPVVHAVQSAAPNLQPLTVYTERQTCTELSPPTDMSKYQAKNYRGLLVPIDGSIGGRSSPAPGTEASPAGVGYHGTPAQARRKRSFDGDGDHGSNSCSKKGRFSFSNDMLEILEDRFTEGRYIAADERKSLADKLGIADVQVKNWFQNRRMKWKRQSTSSHTVSTTESKPATSSQIPHGMSVPSSVVENMEKLAQHGISSKSDPTPFYPVKYPYTAPSSVVAQLQPVHLASNTGVPGAVHPFMAYPHGFAYPFAVQNHIAPGRSAPQLVKMESKVIVEKEERESGENS